MIRYVEHAFIDREKYDHCVKLDRLRLAYGFSWYLDTVAESWDALVLDDYDAVWPLPVRSKWGFKYFYRPFAVQQLGIFSKIPADPVTLGGFVKSLKKHCRFADVYLNEGQAPEIPEDVVQTDNYNYVLPLHRSYEEVYGGYSANHKRNLKKAAKNHFQLFENDSPRALLDLFRNNRGEDLRLGEDFYVTMEKLMYKSMHQGYGKLWTVYGGPNILCAGIFMLEYNGRLTMLFSGSSAWGKETGAMPYLLNEYIIYHSGKAAFLDFEGSNREGLARFYAGFGAERTTYKHIRYNGLPVLLKWLK